MLNEFDWPPPELKKMGHTAEVDAIASRLGFALAKKARFAPSIILRSELQLFGCSSPRFAYRVYFEGAEGFMNIRRLREFTNNIVIPEHGNAHVAGPQAPHGRGLPSVLDDKVQSCVADCLLPRPSGMQKDRFHLVTASLSDAYGESAPMLGFPAFDAIPYVKNITLGGGLCAQACCFMASAVLHKLATGTHGLAEITAIAHSPRCRNLSISGLDERRMLHYFSSIGLSMTVQLPSGDCYRPPHDAESATKLEFEVGLRAYCLSDMPVIFPADYGRMLGFTSLNQNAEPDPNLSIFANNGFKDIDVSKFNSKTTNRHCFAIVGCEFERPLGDGHFIINDPSSHPVLSVTTSQLRNINLYLTPNDNATRRFAYWPVTPAAVKMPLLDYLPCGFFERRRGLRWLSYWHRHSVPSLANIDASNNYLLQQLKSLGEVRHMDPVRMENRWKFRKSLTHVAEKLMAIHSWSPEHWVWLEFFDTSIYLWDAEREPVYDCPNECLLAILKWKINNVDHEFPPDFELD